MATEADIPEAISVTKEGEGRYLTSGQFDIMISQCSPVQVNKSEGESDQHLETVKCFAEGENTQVGCSAQVESKNSSIGISEGGSFLASPSDSKVDKQETCVSENSQGDESNQAEMESLDKEDQLLRGKEFGVVEETESKEKEVVEEIDKKAEQHIESHGIANDLDEHVQVISDQQDSINENPQCVEKEAKSSHEDVKGRQMADEIADSSSEHVSVLLEERSFQEDEAAVRTLDLTNNSFKKDIMPETSIDENTDNTSSTNTIFQEEFEEETGIKGLKNKAPESFYAVYEEKPEATVFNNDRSTDDDSSSTIVAGPDIPNDEPALEAKECAEDKLQKTSMTDDHEEKAGLEVGKKANEAPGIPDTPLITQTEEAHLPEVGNPDIFEVYPEIGSEDIIKESPKEPEYQNEFLEETPEASNTASETVKDDESSERHFGSPCMKHEENTQRKGEALDVGEAKAGEEEDSQGFAAVGPIQETEQSNMNSAEHKGETETNLVEQIESAHYDTERPFNLNSEENDTESLRENTKTITTDEAERQVINLEQSFKKEGKEDSAIPSYEITEDEIPEEKVLKEPEISGGGESTTRELNKNIEIPENITSTVKCEEGEQGEGKNTAPTKATEEDHRDEDPFTVEVAEEDHDYNSAISVTEMSAKVTSNDEEDAPQALQKYEPGGELQNVLDVMPEDIKTETSRESAEVIICRKEERTIQNSQESSDKEKKEDIESTNNTEENDTAVVEACTKAADLSTIIEEKNLEEQEIQKLSSSLLVEETTKEISEEEEIYGVILKEERKEAHAKCKEPAEGANLTQDFKSETTEDRTETDKDIYAPISEGGNHAEESKKTFVPKNSFLSDVPEMEIEKHFQVNYVPTVRNFDSVSGIVSQVTGLEEAETENQEQEKKNDITPEEKVLPTIFTSEKIDVQEEENFNSKEKFENQIPTTADKPETCLKEAEAENKEHVQNIDPEEKGVETILTDKTALDIEDIAVQAGENFNSKENLEEQIPTAADEGETFWKEAEAENKKEIKHTDIASEEKGQEIILTDETALNIEDINVQAEENLNSKNNLEKQIPTSADEGETFLNEAEVEKEEEIKHTDIAPEEKGLETILTDETALDIEDIYVQAEENFNSKENLEEQIPTAADEGETLWKEVEAENKEEIKHTDIASEEKGLETILTDETALDIEDINVQAEENLNSKDNLEEQIPTSADEAETFSNEAEAENKEGIKHTDIAPDKKGLETILTDETALDIEDIYVQAEENFNSKDNLEEQIPTTADEHESCLKEAQAENKEQVKNTDIIPEEKGLVTILTDGTSLDIEDIYVQAEETFNANENLEGQIPKAADEGETFLKEVEAQNEEQAKNIDIGHEEKGLPTILTDETALDIEDNDVQAEENFNLKENLGKEIQTTADERETFLKEAEAENQEQVKTTDIVPEEKGLATISAVETALDIEDIDLKAEENFNSKEILEKQIPTAANEGETCLKEAESENKEQTKDINIAPEEKGLATILTDETASEIEDSDVQAEENFNSKENLEKQFPTAADEVKTCLKEAKAENKEQVKDTDIVHEEKGLATVLTDDTSLDVEDIDVQAEQNFNSKENLEEQIPTAADEDKTCFKDAETENKEQTKTTDIAPEEKGIATISAVGMALDIEDIDLKAEENLEKQIPTAANEGETCLKEAESKNKEQTKDINIAPEEKGLATTLTDETASEIEDSDVQAEENFNSKENLEKQFPTAADEVATCLKEAKAENKEQVKDADIVHEEKGLATVLTDDTSLDVEDIDVQAEQNFNSKENLEEQIPIAAEEDKTWFKDAETENKEQTKTTDIAPEEKGLATISAVETALDIEDIDLKAEDNFNSKEILEKLIPTAANEGETCLKEAESENKEQTKDINIAPEEKGLATILTDEKASEIEDSDVQAEENFNSKENLEKQFPTAADEVETCLKEARAENKEQVNDTDIVHEEKGLATVLTDDTSLDVEDIDVQAEQNFNSKENLEERIPTAADEDKTCFKDAETENKEQTETTDIAPEEKGLATISAVETALDVEDTDVQEEQNFKSKENLDKQIPTAAYEGETCLKEAESENKERTKDISIAPEGKGLATILIDETASEIEDSDVQAEENFNSKENFEKKFPTAADEVETCLKEAKAENKEQVEDTDIVHEEKGLATVLTDDTSLDVEDIDVQAEQNFNSKENMEEHIPTAADEDKTCFKDAETENKEHTKTTDIAPEEKGLATISAVETALDIEDIDVKAEEILEKQITTAADEGETGLKDAEAEKNEQVKNDIAPEEKVLATILTDETLLDVEDIDVQAEQNFNSKGNLEVHIPAAADEGGTCLKEAKAENNEQIKDTDIVHEEKGLATVLKDDTSMDIEDIDVQAEQNFNSKENLEEQIPTAADEDKTCFKDAETENKEQTKTTDTAPEEKGLATISAVETALDIEDIDVKAEEIFNSKEILEKQITTAADEGETGLKDARTENHEKVKNDIAPEERVLATILTDETASEIEDSDVQAEESFNLKENLEKQIPTAADEGETGLKESESEHNERVENDIAPEEKVLATILTDETALDIEEIYVEAEGGNFDSTEFVENQIPTEAGKTTEQSFQVQSLEEADPTLGVEDESHETEDHPEKNNMIVEEVFDKPKITGRDLNKEEILEGNVTFSPESIEEDTGNNSQEIEKEIKNLKEEGSSVESMKEGNGDDLSPEYIPEDESEKFKEDKMDAVESKEEILEESHTAGIGENTVSETNKIAEEILSTLPVKYEEGQQGEGSIPASAKASKEEDPIEDTFPVKLAEVEDDDISTVAVIETSAKVIGEEGSPRAVQKYEPGEGLQKLLDVMPEETKAESSRENAQVITCTKEERAIQNIKESNEEDTNAINDAKEKDTGSEEVLERNSREQETGEHALREIHPQEFNDKETTEDNSTEYQACIEAADFSTKIVQGNLEEQANRELSSSLVGDNIIKESSEEEENYVSTLKEEKKEAHEECKEPIEVTNMMEEETEETDSETFEDKRKPNEDLCTPISEEETHAEESNSFQSEVSEKDGSTVINSDSVSGIVRHQTVLKEAEAENKEQVENTDTALDVKGLATILTDGTTLDVEGIDEQSDENSNSKEFSESQIPTVAVVDEGEEKVGLGNINLDDAPVNFQVQSLEEAEPTLRVEDENNNMIAEEVKPQMLDQVFDEPKNTEGDFNKGQVIEANAAIFSPELIQEETVKNSQDNDKETEKLKEEGSSIENIKELNANDLQLESIPEDGSEKFKDDKLEAVKFKGEILQELHAAGVGEGTACETSKIAERSEEIFYSLPVKYEEGPLGEGNSPTSAKASNEEDKDEETFSVKVAEDDDSNNGAVTVTETSEKVTSNEEGDSSQSLEKYELGEEVQVKTSDLAYENKVYNLEVKASFAERTAEETSLRKEGHKEVSDLALEKLDVDATDEEIREGSEIVPKSDSQSIDVVSKDDIIACQALHEGISKEQLQIPSSTLLPEEKELKSNQHEHETTTQDKNIEEEHTHERAVPADENTGDLFAARSVEEAHLQKEEPRELKASELSLEKLDAGESEEEIKESFETVSKSDCLSIDTVSKDEIIDDQTLLEGITDMQLQIPSHSLLPKEEELKTYEHKHGITTQDKSIEEEHAKKIEMPEETILHKEEPRELKVSELAPEELNADETEEVKETFETVSKADSQSTDVVSKDEIIAYQIVHEGISKEQLQIPSSILLHEEKEIKASEDEHGTTSEEIRPQKEEPKDAKVSEMALKTLDADETAEETEEICETANKFASQSIDVVTEDEVVDDQTLCKVILKETPSTAFLTGETKHATITTTEEENMSNVQIQDDENGNAASTAEEKSLPKEEPSELKVFDVELYSSEELQKESSNEVHEEERSSLIGVPEVEPHEDEEGERYDDSPLGNQKTTELKGTTMEASNLDIETSENASDCAPEEGFSRSQDATINREHLKNEANEANETNETIKNEVSNEQKHLEVAISDSRAEERWCETTIEANETRKNEVSNEEMEAEKLEAKDLRPISVSGENISHREQENELIAEKYEGEKSESFNTARNENQDNEESPKETTQVAKHLTEDKELQTEENLCDTTVEANEKIKTGLSNDEIKEDKELPKDSEADSVREESHQEKKTIAEEYQVEKTNESSVIRTNENRGELPEEKDTTASKEVQTEEEEEEHENAEEVKTYEETGENEHKNAEPGYDSPVIVEASRDADAKISHKKSHNILSGIKHSISKVKKAITGKSSHSKTQSEK
ncbi:unnamed protein product [Prunus armeniaca]